MKSKAFFITFEGGEGAGKSSLMDRMAALFTQKKIPFIKTREPGGTRFGEQLRQWILDHEISSPFGAKAELMLFLAARAQHIEEKIAPALQEGKSVLCDRFNDSTVAYQGAGRGLGTEWVRTLCNLVCRAAQPDITFYLDLEPEIGLKRRRQVEKQEAPSGQLDRIESEALSFHQRLRTAFCQIAREEPNRFFLIDASQPIDAVYAAAVHLISEHFPYV